MTIHAYSGDDAMINLVRTIKAARQPTVTIYTYLLGDLDTPILKATMKVLNQCGAHIYVGATRYSLRVANRQIKKFKKKYPDCCFSLSMYDHRKAWVVEDYKSTHVWVGSQNLCEPNTTNLMVTLTPEQSRDVIMNLSDMQCVADGLITNAK